MSSDAPRILKANDLRGLGSRIAFNYEDLRRRCDQHLEKTRAETRRLIEDAQQEVEQIRQRAQQDGLAAGRREGMQKAEDEINRRAAERADAIVKEKLRTLLPALQSATTTLATERDRWLTQWESAAVGLSVAVAEKVLRRELNQRPEIAREMIAGALQLAAGSPEIRLRLHPDDLQLLGAQAEDVVRSMASCGHATIAPDESVARGGCHVETGHGTIDARIETQLERIASELLNEAR